MTYEYAFRIVHEDDGSAVLDFESFPEIVVEITRSDMEEGKVRSIAADAVRNALQARIDYNDDIPSSDKGPHPESAGTVSLSPLDLLKVTLYLQFRKTGASRAEFAKRAAVTPTGLARAFDLYHASRFDVLIEMFSRLGYSVSAKIDVRRSAAAG
jgi:hypothetical protein